jgi:hypothetical protein
MVVRIGYNRLWGPAMLVLAAVNVALFVMTGALLQLFITVMFGILGVMYLVRPFLIVDEHEIVAKGLMGYTLRRFRHDSFADLEVERDAIVMPGRQRLRLPRLMISQGDLKKLASAVRDARAAKASSAA